MKRRTMAILPTRLTGHARATARRAVLGGALVLVAVVPVAVAHEIGAAASTSTAVWSVPAAGNGRPIATPDGSVLADGDVGPASTISPLQKLTPTGHGIWQLPITSSPPQLSSSFPAVTDINKNTYVELQDTTNGNAFHYIESLDAAGHVRWISTALPFSWPADYFALGWNGVLYVGARLNGTGGVVGLGEATGAQRPFVLGADVTGLFAFPTGIAVVQDSEETDFYDYSGALVAAVSSGSALGAGSGFSSAGGGNGKVFLGGFASGTGAPSVEEVTFAGIQWTWTGPPTALAFGQSWVAATPDGGVIVQDETTDWSISPTGATRWTFTPTPPQGTLGFSNMPLVDSAGNVVLTHQYQYSVPNFPQPVGAVETNFLTESSSTPGIPTVDLHGTDCPVYAGVSLSTGFDSVAIGPGQLYLGLQDNWIGVNQPCAPNLTSIQAFSAPGLGSDYNLALTIPGGAASIATGIGLSPTQQALKLGTSASVTATPTDTNGNPVPNVFVDFDVISGPDRGLVGTGLTGQGGSAVFSFTNSGVSGDDSVQASFVDGSGIAKYNSAVISFVDVNPYVALGDSFSSGETNAPYPGTDSTSDGCHRSRVAYPVSVSAMEGTGVAFVACSGARIQDVEGANSKYPIEGVQLDRVNQTTNHVTITIGGNNVGFDTLIADCVHEFFAPAKGGSCRARDSSLADAALTRLTTGKSDSGCVQMPGIDLQTGNPAPDMCGPIDSLHGLYERIAQRMPTHGSILVAGYPQLFGSPRGACEVGRTKLTLSFKVLHPDVVWLNQMGALLNSEINGEVQIANQTLGGRVTVKFIDVNSAFNTHRLCDSGAPWISGIQVTGLRRWSIDPEHMPFHPTQPGQNAYANAIIANW
jgi:hypothetical protein